MTTEKESYTKIGICEFCDNLKPLKIKKFGGLTACSPCDDCQQQYFSGDKTNDD